MLRMFYHNGQFFLQIDTFSLLRGAYFFQALLRGGLFNLAKRITCSKNTVVWDRVDLRIVQLKSPSKVFNSLVGA